MDKHCIDWVDRYRYNTDYASVYFKNKKPNSAKK